MVSILIAIGVAVLSVAAVGLYLIAANGGPLPRGYVLREADGTVEIGWHACAGEHIDTVTLSRRQPEESRPIWALRNSGDAGTALRIILGSQPAGFTTTTPYEPAGDNEVIGVEIVGTSGVLDDVEFTLRGLPRGTFTVTGGEPRPLSELVDESAEAYC